MPEQRKASNRSPEKTLRIFCEGANTEPYYIGGYLGTLADQRRKKVIKIQIEETRKNTPVQLVEEAIKHREQPTSLPEDEYWVVYDRESSAKYDDTLHGIAFDKANRHGIHLAISNVCIEYWVLLHFIDTSAPYESCDDLLKRSSLKSLLRKQYSCNYEKSSKTLFSKLKDKIPDARQRAARLNQQGKAAADPRRTRPYQINPYMGMVDLLDAIDKFT